MTECLKQIRMAQLLGYAPDQPETWHTPTINKFIWIEEESDPDAERRQETFFRELRALLGH